MSTLSWISDVAVKTADEAIKLMFEDGKRSVVLYNSNEKTLSSAEVQEIMDKVIANLDKIGVKLRSN